MAAVAALQSSMAGLSLSSNSFLGLRLSVPFSSSSPNKMQDKPTLKPCQDVAKVWQEYAVAFCFKRSCFSSSTGGIKLKRWERKKCKPNSLPILQKMHVKVGDTVKVITRRDKGKIGERAQVFRHSSMVLLREINIKIKHIKSKEEGEPGEIIRIEAPFRSSNVTLYSKDWNVASRVDHKILEDGTQVRYLVKTGEVIDSAENWKKLKESKGKVEEAALAAT